MIESSSSHAQIAESLSDEVRLTARLGIPLAVGELGWMSTYIVDALMIGRLPHSALSISASSLGNTIFYAIAFCAIGLFTGIETLAAQAFGRGNSKEANGVLAQALWFVAISTPVVMIATLAAVGLLPYCGTPPEIIAETRSYLNALVWSTAPLLLYWALRMYLQSINRVLMIMISLLSAGVVNFAADWAFLYGHLGLHPYGVAGSGWATCIVRVFALFLLLFSLSPRGRQARSHLSRQVFQPDIARLKALFRIGWPTALRSFVDLGASTFLSIICARLGATLLAAHQVVLDLNAFVYMVPLGISYATATRVGQSAGRKSLTQVRRAAKASLLMGLAFIAIAAALFAGFPHFWASLYTNDMAAVQAAGPIFLICGIIQIGDTAGIILAGALVGVGETKMPLLANTIWSWLIGMPLSYWLTFNQAWGLKGLWIGRAVASVGAPLMLAIFWRLRIRKDMTLSFSTADLPANLPLRYGRKLKSAQGA